MELCVWFCIVSCVVNSFAFSERLRNVCYYLLHQIIITIIIINSFFICQLRNDVRNKSFGRFFILKTLCSPWVLIMNDLRMHRFKIYWKLQKTRKVFLFGQWQFHCNIVPQFQERWDFHDHSIMPTKFCIKSTILWRFNETTWAYSIQHFHIS